MKIGIFVSPRHSVPSSESQRNVAWDMAGFLADGLVKKGVHTVYLFASNNSTTSARHMHFDLPALDSARESLSPASYREEVAKSEANMFVHMMEVAVSEHLDVIHFHEPNESLVGTISQTTHTMPFVFTIHEPILSNRLEGLEALGKLDKCFLVTISQAQRNGFHTIPFAQTVYYGLSPDQFPVGAGSPHQLMVAGRVSPEKGFEDAIQTASATGKTLVIAGKVDQNLLGTNSYFREKIEPRMYDALLVMKQFLRRDELNALYGSSQAFLYPTKWEEPFAMVMLEAMACGTPVVGYNRGCVPEVVVDGVTGVDGLVEAMGRISEIKRDACRKHIEDHFSVEKMVESHENFYKKILGK